MDLERNIKPWMLYSGICERTITTLRTKWTFHSNSLDLSKAFDTINQDPLLKRLKCNSIRDLALYQLSPKLIDDIAFSREFQFFMIFFFVLVNMGEKNSKRYSYKSQPEFLNLSWFFSQWSSQNYIWDLRNLENWNFNDFFRFL